MAILPPPQIYRVGRRLPNQPDFSTRIYIPFPDGTEIDLITIQDTNDTAPVRPRYLQQLITARVWFSRQRYQSLAQTLVFEDLATGEAVTYSYDADGFIIDADSPSVEFLLFNLSPVRGFVQVTWEVGNQNGIDSYVVQFALTDEDPFENLQDPNATVPAVPDQDAYQTSVPSAPGYYRIAAFVGDEIISVSEAQLLP